MSDMTTSHDPRDWREAFETSEPGPELNRIRARVAAARQRGENDALVAVVLDEASGWRVRALEAEERAEELSRVAATLTEREAAATRRLAAIRALVAPQWRSIFYDRNALIDDIRAALADGVGA